MQAIRTIFALVTLLMLQHCSAVGQQDGLQNLHRRNVASSIFSHSNATMAVSSVSKDSGSAGVSSSSLSYNIHTVSIHQVGGPRFVTSPWPPPKLT